MELPLLRVRLPFSMGGGRRQKQRRALWRTRRSGARTRPGGPGPARRCGRRSSLTTESARPAHDRHTTGTDDRKEPVMPLFTEYLTVQPWQRALERLDGARTVSSTRPAPAAHPRVVPGARPARAGLHARAPGGAHRRRRHGQGDRRAALAHRRPSRPHRDGHRPPVAGLPRRADRAGEGLAPLETDAVLRTARQSVTESATAAALAAGREVGIEVREVVVKDVILPPSCGRRTSRW